jgi:hypothetical protein
MYAEYWRRAVKGSYIGLFDGGGRQGHALSPLLYIIYDEVLNREEVQMA